MSFTFSIKINSFFCKFQWKVYKQSFKQKLKNVGGVALHNDNIHTYYYKQFIDENLLNTRFMHTPSRIHEHPPIVFVSKSFNFSNVDCPFFHEPNDIDDIQF